MLFRSSIWVFGLLGAMVFVVGPVVADHPEESTDADAGHSYHGGAFNEGPRQAAYLMGNTGDVAFELTTRSDDCRAFFLQGLGQLHGFWYFEAERSFRQAAYHDPDCAMAYWGMAQANIDNQKRARGFLAEGLERREKASKREQAYLEAFAAYLGLPTKATDLAKIESLADFEPKRSDKDRRGDYVRKLEDLTLDYPDDVEAKAFLLVQLWFNSRKGHPMNSTVAVNSLAREILAVNPNHPAHHYRIHIWDYRRAGEALDSAAACGFAAPGIAHMWHMPGHVYSKLQRYADAAWHQEASARTDHRHMMRDGVMPDQIHNFAHNNEWLTRNLMHLGRVSDALDLAMNMIELPRHPKYNTVDKRGSASLGRLRLVEVLTNYELWEEAIAACDSSYLAPTAVQLERARRLRLLGRACFATGDLERGRQALAMLVEVRSDTLAEEKKAREEKAAKEAEANKGKEKPAENKEPKEKRPQPSRTIKFVDTAERELQLAEALATGAVNEKLADKELKPNQLEKNLVIEAYLAAEEFDKALEISRKEVDRGKKQVQPLARHVRVLQLAGKMDEARESFDELRKLAQDVELARPPFARLAELAESFGYPTDWRLPRPAATDVRQRPDLEYLGPFRWQPSQAVQWKLADHTGKRTTLAELNDGQDLLVIFYLGADCLHCVEQLNAFAPMAKAYADAGIQIIGVSIEDVKSLQASVGSYSEDGRFPFPLFANPSESIFKAYRAYDDFEQQPLHGTFLIDKEGKIRWRDVSYEPFTEPKFLLEEAKRLLDTGRGPAVSGLR